MKIIIDLVVALASLQDKIDSIIRRGASYVPSPPVKLFSPRLLRLWRLADSLANNAYSAAVDRMARRLPTIEEEPASALRDQINYLMYGPHTLMDNRPNGCTPDDIVKIRLSVVRS